MNVVLTQGDNLHRNNKFDSGADLKAKGFQRIVNDKIDDNIVWLEEDCDFFVRPNETVLIKTGVHIEMPEPTEQVRYGNKWYYKALEAQVRPRSGLTLKESVLANLGSIDIPYRGDVGIIFTNNRKESYRIKRDDRVAQLTFSECVIPVDDFNMVDKLGDGDRGSDGFGSSGK